MLHLTAEQELYFIAAAAESRKDRTKMIEREVWAAYKDELDELTWCPARSTKTAPCRYSENGWIGVKHPLSAIILHLNDDHKTWEPRKVLEWMEVKAPEAAKMGALVVEQVGWCTGGYVMTGEEKGVKVVYADPIGAIWLGMQVVEEEAEEAEEVEVSA